MRIGPHEVLGELGRGGAGVVYRARTEGQDLAIKVLLRADADGLARFERERRLLAALGEEKGFVPLLGAGETAGRPYLVMPFLGGGTLRDRFARGPQTIEATIELARALARALGEAHALGIVHRDLKPENVLFTTAGRPLVADLGLAKHFRGDEVSGQTASLSRAGAFLGTAGYMAPEQILDAKAVGPSADVHALGAILHEALTGRPAFVGDSVVELLAKVTEGRVQSVGRLRPEAPDWLVRAIDRALDHDPRRRFSDGLAFELALRPARKRGALVGALLLAGAGLFVLAARGLGALREPTGARGAPLAVSTPEPRPSSSPEVAHLVRAAEEKMRRRDLPGVLAACDEVIRRDPKVARAWALRSRVRQARGDSAGALADANEAIRLDPRDADAWTSRGAARGMRHEASPAIADFTEAIRLNPRDLRAWGSRSAARELLRDHDGALADATEAIRLDPGEATSWSLRAALRRGSGDDAGALADATEAIRLNPSQSIAYRVRGGVRFQRGDRAGAIEDFERFLELAPDDPKAPVVRRELERARLAEPAAGR